MPEVSSTGLRENWQKLHKDDQATENQLNKAWQELVDAEMREELKGHRPTLLQVWFPGVHINIGGGSDDLLKDKRGDFERKSNQSVFHSSVRLCFSASRLGECVLTVYRDRDDHAQLDGGATETPSLL